MELELPEYVDFFGRPIKQGDVVLLGVKDSFIRGVALSLSWSKTYNKYCGVRIARLKGKQGFNYTTASCYNGNKVSSLVVVNDLEKAKEGLDELIDSCMAAPWEGNIPGKAADGTIILAGLSRGISYTKNWVDREQRRRDNLKSKQKFSNSYYGYEASPTHNIVSMNTSSGELRFTFKPLQNGRPLIEIKLANSSITYDEVFSTFNVSSEAVDKRINTIIEMMTF